MAMASFLALAAVLMTGVAAGETKTVPAIYVFGDSTVDVGINNHLPGPEYSIFKANYPHNGVDFPQSIPTGRFCNGFIGIDFMSMKMGFEKSPPPLLRGRVSPAKDRRGISFASGGSGILDETGKNFSLSMNAQIKLFRHRARLRDPLLRRSVFAISTANNDLFNFFSSNPVGAATNSTLQDEFISLLAGELQKQLKSLYRLGARKMVVFGVGRLGCTPLLRKLSPSGDCVEVLNLLSKKFNAAMRSKMTCLAFRLRHLQYSYVNSYAIDEEIAHNAPQLGFKELKSACCGGGLLNADEMCTPNATYCNNRDEYVFWDFVHPTQAYYKTFVDVAFSSSFVEPTRLLDLLPS